MPVEGFEEETLNVKKPTGSCFMSLQLLALILNLILILLDSYDINTSCFVVPFASAVFI